MDRPTPPLSQSPAPQDAQRRSSDPYESFEIKALSTGLGLGGVRSSATNVAAAQGGPARSRATAASALTHPAMTSGRSPAAPPTSSAAAPAPVPPRRSMPLSRRLLAYGLDFSFVAVALTGAACLAIYLRAWRRGDPSAWLEEAPVKWLLHTSPLLTLAAVYAAFLVYAVLFKVVVGKTCGELLLAKPDHPHEGATRI